MTFDHKNSRWPPSKFGHIFATEADIGMVFFLNDICTFSSNQLCGCHLGRAYMSGSRSENAYVNFNLHKKSSLLYFLYQFFCKCILECLAQNRMRADLSFSDNFGQKM